MNNVAAQASEKLTEIVYMFVTTLLIISALGGAMIIPVQGALQGAFILLLLTIKAAIGYIRDKAEQKISGESTPPPPEPDQEAENEEEAEESRAQQIANFAKQQAMQQLKKVAMQTAKAATKSAAKSNVYTLIIDYLTSPMSKLETYFLALGWIMLPAAAAVPFAVIFSVLQYSCQKSILSQVICEYFPSFITTN